MTEPADRIQRLTPRVDPRRAFCGTVRDELARVRGRSLGACAACQQPVFVTQNFTRLQGRLVHERCAISYSRLAER
ncbi:MAG: hypothetical protein QOK16_1449 [Solirubrobacteraceae bacterium]|jgi:hypothetical protein|nr:hypothetical protein [Solirubrobacteraceae bacterium]